MTRGRKKKRTGGETRSTFDKTPELEVAILDLQKRYIKTGRGKPTMLALITEGIAMLLEREGLPAMPKPDQTSKSGVIEMPQKTGA